MKSKVRTKTKTRFNHRVRLYSRPTLWQFMGLAAATAVVMIALDLRSVPGEPMAGWYQLKSIVPGERVPEWLYTGLTYRGMLTTGGQVRLFAPDSALTAVVSAALVTEVAGPS